jgi:hypothetical protein
LQDLHGPADLVVATDDRVELAVAGALGEIDRVLLERLALPFGFLRIDAPPPRTVSIAVSKRFPREPTSLRSRPVSPLSSASASRKSSLAMNWSPRFAASLSVRLRRLLRSRETLISPPGPRLWAAGRSRSPAPASSGTATPARTRSRRTAVVLLEQAGKQVLGLDIAVVVGKRLALGVGERLLEFGRQLVEAHCWDPLIFPFGLLRNWGLAPADSSAALDAAVGVAQ